MFREIFTKFQMDMSKFNPNELIIVTYDKDSHVLQFSQMTHVVMTPYLGPYFSPKKGFKIGVLTQSGYNKLMYNIQNLLKDHTLDEGKLIPDIVQFGTDWYRCYGDKKLPYPVKLISLKYVNVTNQLLTKLLCMTYNNNSKILYNVAKKSMQSK